MWWRVLLAYGGPARFGSGLEVLPAKASAQRKVLIGQNVGFGALTLAGDLF